MKSKGQINRSAQVGSGSVAVISALRPANNKPRVATPVVRA
jgi:hypothetical protein